MLQLLGITRWRFILIESGLQFIPGLFGAGMTLDNVRHGFLTFYEAIMIAVFAGVW